MQRILELNLHKKWFDMILSGEKKEEYREVKDFWRIRLFKRKKGQENLKPGYLFSHVRFSNGYAKNRRQILVKIHYIELDPQEGYEKWGAIKGEKYYVIKLLDVVSTKNIL